MNESSFELLPFRNGAWRVPRSIPAGRPGRFAPPPIGFGPFEEIPFGESEFELEGEVDRSSRAYAVWVQSSLNRILRLNLATDGLVGTLTRSAIRSFQTRKGLAADGIVGPVTEAALIAAGAGYPPGFPGPAVSPLPSVPPPPAYGPPSNGARLAWGARVSPAFRSRVRQIGAELGVDPNFLMAVMAFETNESFDPAIRNSYSGATGLIQFIPSTAAKLGTSTDALARMSAERQLDYVASYFRPHRGQLRTIEDVYMAVLWPKAIGKTNATVLFAAPSQAYEWNRGLDSNGDGRVTKAEAAAPVRARLSKGLGAGFIG